MPISKLLKTTAFQMILAVMMLISPSYAQDEGPIRHLMINQFDRPEARLSVAAIAIESPYAIASWLQDGRGGRALLRIKEGNWSIILCSGESLTNKDSLVQIGIDPHISQRLINNLTVLEKKLSEQDRLLLDTFEGEIILEGNAHTTIHTHNNEHIKH